MLRTKLLLVIPHLGGGGAERVTALLARYLDPGRFEIHLCLITSDVPGAQTPPPWVQVHRFHRKHVRQAWLLLIDLIRTLRPDVLLSGMAHLNFLILLLRPFLPPRTRILVRQNTTASSAAQTWLSRFAYRLLYPRADLILCQSRAMAEDLSDNFAIPPAQLSVLLNPVDTIAIGAQRLHLDQSTDPTAPWPANSWPRLLTVGRLAHEKGTDLLLRAFREIKPYFPQIHLAILGSGPAEAALKLLSSELNLESAITFTGYQENPAEFYPGATLFVLPSRYEGMPNALLEAAAAGLPLITTPSSRGLCDLLGNAPGTWISPEITVHSLAQTIFAAQSTLNSLQEPPQRFHHAFLTPFKLQNAIATYADQIELAASQARQ